MSHRLVLTIVSNQQVTRIIDNFVDASIDADILNYVIMSYGDPCK